MKSRPTTNQPLTIQFHRGNPESPDEKNRDEMEAKKENENRKPFEENNLHSEDTRPLKKNLLSTMLSE
ncbi:MAG TPA: hypothetical protein VGQ59_06585 [Cyclobacteriaceae bacterium]|jgi:hypothetical protein|nr:hypothetical protein [Cyclobacteriaceae bacterium]